MRYEYVVREIAPHHLSLCLNEMAKDGWRMINLIVECKWTSYRLVFEREATADPESEFYQKLLEDRL